MNVEDLVIIICLIIVLLISRLLPKPNKVNTKRSIIREIYIINSGTLEEPEASFTITFLDGYVYNRKIKDSENIKMTDYGNGSYYIDVADELKRKVCNEAIREHSKKD